MKKINLLIILTFFMSILLSSKVKSSESYVYYYVFIINKKINSWCDTDLSFQSIIVPDKVSYKIRQAIVDKRKKVFENKEDFNLKVEQIWLKTSEYLVIYKVTNKTSIKGCENYEKYHAIRAKTKEEIDEKIKLALKVSFTKNTFVSYEIISVQEPLINKGPNFINKLSEFFRNYSLEKDTVPSGATSNSPAIGVRG
jgi:hypothetical protein